MHMTKYEKYENRTEFFSKQIQGEVSSLCQPVEAVSASVCKQNHLENVWMIFLNHIEFFGQITVWFNWPSLFPHDGLLKKSIR